MTTTPDRKTASTGNRHKPAPAVVPAPTPAAPAPAPAPAPAETNASRPVRPREQALALLRREQGATMAELTAATGWLPHSTRAILSGLRKQGHAVVRSKRGAETCYTIPGEA